MKDMKRPWVSYLAVASVLLLLTLFLGLQYNWQLQASSAERDRMHRRVEEDARRFAEDFNKEVQAAFFNFQAAPESLEAGDAAEISERYDYWKRNTEFPDLIKEVDYMSNTPGTSLLKFDPENRRFVSLAPDVQTSAIIQRIGSEKRPPSIIEDGLTLVVPIRAQEKYVENVIIRRVPDTVLDKPVVEMPKSAGYIIIKLDEAVMKEKLLPALAARHFQPSEFNVSITDHSGAAVFNTGQVSQDPDSKAPLYDLTPDNLIFFSNRNLFPRKATGHKADMVVDQRVESHTVTARSETIPDQGQTFKIEMKDGDGPRRTAMITGTNAADSPWTLNIQHTAGSIDNYIRNERNKSFLIGLGVYLLLVGSILAIVLSAMRSRAFAQRQIDFVSSVSHEFRTPLAVIYSAGENLADGVAKDEVQVSRYGNLIKGEGKKLTGMVEQILEFAGARSGRKKYSFGETDVSGVVRNAVDECEPQIKEAGFEIEANIADGLSLAKADGESIETAIKNLIQNALKYSNGSKWIGVAASNGNGTVKISVKDRGIGVASSELKQIFEPFYRSKDVVDAQIHGNGLGLSLVKEIAEAHGGTVTVQSEPGKGSTFTLELP